MTEATAPTAAIEADAQRLLRLIEQRDWASARAASERLLEAAPEDPTALTLAARVAYDAHDDAADAIQRLQKALAIAPRHTPALSLLYTAYWTLGDGVNAQRILMRLIDAEPSRGAHYYRLATLDASAATPYANAIQRLVVAPEASTRDRVSALTALGRIFDHHDKLDAAVGAYLAAKRCLGRPFDAERLARRYGWSAEAIATASPETSARRMAFIVGMPRSGTSLIERVLTAHPEATDVGERTELAQILKARFLADEGYYEDPRAVAAAGPEAWREMALAYEAEVRPFARDPDAPVWIDKLPSNFTRVGLAAVLFPKARFIIARREPRDVFVSCMKLYFHQGHGFTESFERFAQYYVLERTFAALWRERLGDRVIEVSYEDVTADVEGEARRMIAHLGLDWRAECAAPHLARGTVKTASALQVREPVHRRSVAIWRRYANQIAPLDQLLSAYEASLSGAAAA